MTAGEECQFSSDIDGRKLGHSKLTDTVDLKKRNEQLRKHILALERALSLRSISISEALEEAESALGNGNSADGQLLEYSEEPESPAFDVPHSAKGEDRSDDPVTDDFNKLQVDDLSELCHYGPSSALSHLASTDPSLQSPLTTVPPSRGAQDSAELNWRRNLPKMGISKTTCDEIMELTESFFVPWCMVRKAFRV